MSAFHRWNSSFSVACIASLAAIALAIGPSTAYAGTATLTWTAPTTNEDGSTLTDLTGWLIEYGLSPSALTQSVRLTNPGLRSYGVENLAAGEWHFAMRTIAGTTERQSALTNTVSKTVQADPPDDGLHVSAPTIYSLSKQRDALVFVPIGTVPVGTPCLEDRAGAYFAVPRAAVTFSGATRPLVVFAACD